MGGAGYRITLTLGESDDEFPSLHWVIVQLVNALRSAPVDVKIRMERVECSED